MLILMLPSSEVVTSVLTDTALLDKVEPGTLVVDMGLVRAPADPGIGGVLERTRCQDDRRAGLGRSVGGRDR